jgi:hypothetical protein
MSQLRDREAAVSRQGDRSLARLRVRLVNTPAMFQLP